MPSTTERTARKPRPCGNYPCRRTIEVGQRYRRHVAFPGDEGHEEGTQPWVINECGTCWDNSEKHTADYIRSYYGVPAQRGMRVTYNGRPATIVGFGPGATLQLRVDGEKLIQPCHPTWRIEYPPTGGGDA